MKHLNKKMLLVLISLTTPLSAIADKIDALDEVTMQVIDLEEDLSQTIPRVIQFPAAKALGLAKSNNPKSRSNDNRQASESSTHASPTPTPLPNKKSVEFAKPTTSHH